MASSAVDKLTSRHRRIMEAIVYDGLQIKEVAAQFGITESRLCILRKSPLWNQEEDEMRKEHRKTYTGALASLLPQAVQALKDTVIERREIEVLNKEGELDTKVIYNDPKDRLAAAKTIFDRAGIIPGIQITDVARVDSEILYDSLAAIRERKFALLRELGMEALGGESTEAQSLGIDEPADSEV